MKLQQNKQNKQTSEAAKKMRLYVIIRDAGAVQPDARAHPDSTVQFIES